MQLIVQRDDPVEEIAAEPDTMQRLLTVLEKGRRTVEGARDQFLGGGGLLDLPRVEDPTIPALTVLLRPSTTAPLAPSERHHQ